MGLFSSKKKLRTDGYYLANKTGFSELINMRYNLFYILYFNDNGIVAFLEFEDEPKYYDRELHFDFLKETTYDKFSVCSRYEIKNNKIKMKFYVPDSPSAFENGEVNQKNYRQWEGDVKNNELTLSFFKSYFNDSLMDYTIDYYFTDLNFQFHKN